MRVSSDTSTLVRQWGAADAFRMIREAGFEAVDWGIDTDWKIAEIAAAERLEGHTVFERSIPEIEAYFAEQLTEIRKNGLVITQAHAPFPPYVPGRPDILEYAIGVFRQVIRFCAAVDCPRLVIHGITKQEIDTELTPDECERLNLHLYESLIPTLKEVGSVTVCLENLFTMARQLGAQSSFTFWEGCCSDPHVAARWIDHLNELAGAKYFGLCLDTGHLHVLSKPFHAYVPILGDRIVALHIQDTEPTADRHLMPYTGSVRWEDFLREMKAIGYKGDISFETASQTKAERLPGALVPTFLRTTVEIGRYFRSELM